MDNLVGIVIQARTGSSRLPGKVLLDFHQGCSILDIILEKFKSKEFEKYPKILATSDSAADSALHKVATKHGCIFFQGSEDNVLNRFIEVGNKYNLTHLLRICADNPFLNIGSVETLLNTINSEHLRGEEIDYLSFLVDQDVPAIRSHLGLFAEIVSLRALQMVAHKTSDPQYQEHVTNYIYTNANNFNVKFIPAPDIVRFRKDLRFTVDSEEDFKNMAMIYKNTKVFSEDIAQLIGYLDREETGNYKKIMLQNIKKFNK